MGKVIRGPLGFLLGVAVPVGILVMIMTHWSSFAEEKRANEFIGELQSVGCFAPRGPIEMAVVKRYYFSAKLWVKVKGQRGLERGIFDASQYLAWRVSELQDGRTVIIHGSEAIAICPQASKSTTQ